MEKQVVNDKYGRKIQTTHFFSNGNVDYVNEYIYENSEAEVPSCGLQTHYSPTGQKEKELHFAYDEEKRRFRTEKMRFYNTDGKVAMSVYYNKDEDVTKEKRYSYKDGFTFVHREVYDHGKVVSSGDYVALAGRLLSMDDERVQSIVNNYKCVTGEGQETKKEEEKKPSFFAALKGRMSR